MRDHYKRTYMLKDGAILDGNLFIRISPCLEIWIMSLPRPLKILSCLQSKLVHLVGSKRIISQSRCIILSPEIPCQKPQLGSVDVHLAVELEYRYWASFRGRNWWQCCGLRGWTCLWKEIVSHQWFGVESVTSTSQDCMRVYYKHPPRNEWVHFPLARSVS